MRLFCHVFILNWPFFLCTTAVFTQVPTDVRVGEGQDVALPCSFTAAGAAPVSLEIQWWYRSDPAQVGLEEASKISTVRVHGNAISHQLSLSRVRKEDSGVYECRVSDLWADQTQEFAVRAALHVVAADGMMAEEAVSHMQKRVRNSKPGPKPSPGGESSGQGPQRGPQQAGSGLLPSDSSTISALLESSARPPPDVDVLGLVLVLLLVH